MLLSYLLLFFALTSSVTAQRWQHLLGNTDDRLTKDGYYFFRLMPGSRERDDSWPADNLYDDFIQFGSVGTFGVDAKMEGVSVDAVSAIRYFRLQRKLQNYNEYCLQVSDTYDGPIFKGPWNEMGREKDDEFLLTGYWGRSTKLPDTVTAENKNGRIVEPVAIDVTIQIKREGVRQPWKVLFVETEAFTAPRVYLLKHEVRQQLLKEEAEKNNKRKQQAGPHQGAGTALEQHKALQQKAEGKQQAGPAQGAGTALEQWSELQHNKDRRLTGDVKDCCYWYRLMEDKAITPAWREHKKYDKVIQFVPSLIRRDLPARVARPLTPRSTRPGTGVSARRHNLYAQSGRHGVSPTYWVSGISILGLRRKLEGNQYCLDGPDTDTHTYSTQSFQESLSESNLGLEGFWGRSTKVTAENIHGPVVAYNKLEVIIEIKWLSDVWKVRFLEEIQANANKLATAPAVYTLPDDLAKEMEEEEEEERKRKQLAKKPSTEPPVHLGPAYK